MLKFVLTKIQAVKISWFEHNHNKKGACAQVVQGFMKTSVLNSADKQTVTACRYRG